MTDNPMKLSEVAYGGAEYIAEHGHHKGAYFPRFAMGINEETPSAYARLIRKIDNTAPACMVGGMIAAAYRQTGDIEMAYTAAWKVACLKDTLPSFNDAQDTTAEDVILKLKEAGHALEEEGL